MFRVAVVIPTFRPEPHALQELAATVLAQGAPLLVVDDGSPCTVDEGLRTCRSLGASVIQHTRNRGIARGLNDGLAFASEEGAEWLLTLDQDSGIGPTYIADLTEAAAHAVSVLGPHLVGAVAAGVVQDSSGPITYPTRLVREIPVTEEVLQSGTLWSVAALESIGGFDESLAIDAVDAAACVRLRAAGRRITLAPGVTLHQRLGRSRPVRLFGRTVLATGHGAARRSTIVRNRLRLAPEEFRQSPRHAFRTLRRVAVATLLAVTVEDDRWAKARASAAGLLPGRRR